MKSLNPEFALYASKTLYAWTDTVFFPLSEVSPRAVTLLRIHLTTKTRANGKALGFYRNILILNKKLVMIVRKICFGNSFSTKGSAQTVKGK